MLVVAGTVDVELIVVDELVDVDSTGATLVTTGTNGASDGSVAAVFLDEPPPAEAANIGQVVVQPGSVAACHDQFGRRRGQVRG